MRYPTLSGSDANLHLATKRAGGEPEIDSSIKQRGSGDELNLGFVSKLRRELAALRQEWSAGLQNDRDRTSFEGRAARMVHRLVPACSEAISDPEFWIWLAIVHFPDLVEWRYGNPEGGTKPANFGIGLRLENLLFRLWLRAEIVHDHEAEDPYHLSDAGQIDFYRSHLFRQGFANARALAKALIKYQYPHDDIAEPRLKVAQIREVVKRIRRLKTNLLFEVLPEVDCRALIEMEAAAVLSS